MIDFGHGVVLGPVDPICLDLIRTWRNDPAIWKWCRQNDTISHAQHLRWYEAMIKDSTIKMYLIVDKEAKEPVGVCGLTSIDTTNRRAEFSLYIASNLHKRGLATRAIKTLFSHGFKNLGLHSIWGETFDGNPASKLFEKIGMTKEGTRRDFYFRDGKFIDCHLYGLIGSEWKG